MKNFKVGKELVSILQGSSAVKQALGNKIFPLVAVPNTTFPFMVYRRSYYTPENNKDYEGEKVATAVNHARTNMIDDINITNISENYVEDTFTQQVNIEITLK